MAKKNKKKQSNRNKKQVKDSKVSSTSKDNQGYTTDAFMNSVARLGSGTPNLLEGSEYTNSRITQNYNLLNTLYRSHWIIGKIIDSIPEDMCKNWITVKTQMAPDEKERFTKLQRNTRVKRDILKALKWSRLYGGSGAVMIIEGHEHILDEPLVYDDIMPGSFKGLIVGDRWSGITPSNETITDVTSPEFGLPEFYEWHSDTGESTRVHHTRILRFIGRELPLIERYSELHWGASEVEVIFDELKKRDNTSWNIAQLVFMANLRVLKMNDLGELLAIGDEQAQTELYNTLNAQNQLMNNMSLQVMDKDDEFQNYQYSFSGLSDIYQNFMLDIAGAAEIPVTKLFGRSPAGLSATGESDMQNYYDMIGLKQSSQLEPALDKLMPVMAMSEFGYIAEDLDYEFNPLAEQSEDELADIVNKKTTAINELFNSGIITQRMALKELKDMSTTTGMFMNITEEDIENADNDNSTIGEDLPEDESIYKKYF